MAKKKQIALGLAIRHMAGINPAMGRKLDKMPHGSSQRQKMASAKAKAK